MIVYLWSELLEGKWKFFFYYNKFFIEEFKKLDIEERERVFIQYDLLKVRRDEIVDDYDDYYDEIYYGRFGGDYMRD